MVKEEKKEFPVKEKHCGNAPGMQPPLHESDVMLHVSAWVDKNYSDPLTIPRGELKEIIMKWIGIAPLGIYHVPYPWNEKNLDLKRQRNPRYDLFDPRDLGPKDFE